MAMDVGLIALGIVLLVVGGEVLVRGAVALAHQFRITPAVVGLVIVSAATSMPELVVSVKSALRGSPDLAVGNVIGSNIFNLAPVLGLTALIVTMPASRGNLRVDWPFLLLATVLVLLLMGNGWLGRVEGVILLGLLVAFSWFQVRRSKREFQEQSEAGEHASDIPRTPLRMAINLILLALGVGLMIQGADWMVDGSGGIARRMGVSERVIGLTIVAMGTSLPELASSLVAALRRHSDLAVGNVIGSSIFNLLAIFGVGAILRPLEINPGFMVGLSDWTLGAGWWMLLLTALVGPMMVLGRRQIGKVDGLILNVLFVLFLIGLLRGDTTI